MGWAVAFRLDGTSIVSTREHHLLLEQLWLVVDKIVHHDDVMTRIVVRPWGDVSGLDPNRRDARVVEHYAGEGQVSVAGGGRDETAEYQPVIYIEIPDGCVGPGISMPRQSGAAIWLI